MNLEKKKILMVSCGGLDHGGIQSVMMSIVRSLSVKYVFDIVLFTEDRRYYDDEFERLGGTIFRIPDTNGFSKLQHYLRPLKNAKIISKILAENGPYIAVHCHNDFESGYILSEAKKHAIPIRISHAHISPTVKGHYFRKFANKLSRSQIKKNATHLVACSSKAGDFLFGKKAGYHLIYNPYDEQKFNPALFSTIKCDRLELAQVGSFSGNKNQVFSINVLKRILDLGVDAHLSLVGFELDKGYEKTIKDTIDSLNLGNNVTIYPSDYNVPLLLSRSFALLLPSRSEGFPIVSIEGQAMGVHCYVSNSVTQEINVGGCTYLDVENGLYTWADTIIADFKCSDGNRGEYNCSSFSTQEIVSSIETLYKGLGESV